jgi:leucyl aminopeptidase
VAAFRFQNCEIARIPQWIRVSERLSRSRPEDLLVMSKDMAPKIQLSSANPVQAAADLLAIGVFEGKLPSQSAFARIDHALGGALAEQAAQADFTGKSEQVLELATVGAITPKRVLVVGLGAKHSLTAADLRVFAATAARAAAKRDALAIILPDKVSGTDLRSIAEGVVLGAYQFSKYFTGDRAPKRQLQSVSLYKATGKPTASEGRAIALGSKIAAGVCLARDAVNEPPNELNPEGLAKIARSIAKQSGFKVTVLDKAGIKKAGMNLHYAVGQGSSNEPRFIHLSYTPKGAKKSIAFVGKGLTFDSGGLSIKPAAGMGDMKNDMGGAAAVLGLMVGLAVTKPKIAVHGIIGAAENMPDGAAYRPGDIFKSMEGKTVEIINTDAEGRLVLADALAYASRLKPDLIVDAATLTGACLVALGKSCSAYYATDEQNAKRFQTAASAAGEQFWRMPLLADLSEQLQSDVADLKHTGERWGGSITAALFLKEFVGAVPWIHCDIAGPVTADRAQGFYPKGGTGHPILTFLSLVENFA